MSIYLKMKLTRKIKLVIIGRSKQRLTTLGTFAKAIRRQKKKKKGHIGGQQN